MTTPENAMQISRGEIRNGEHSLPRWFLFALGCSMMLSFAACDLLEVNDPEVIEPGELGSRTGRQTLFFGAVSEFARAYAGDAAERITGAVLLPALLTDEWVSSGTVSDRIVIDARRVGRGTENDNLDGFFAQLQQARVALERAAQAYAEAGERPDREALARALHGYTLTLLAESFCSGVPLSQAAIGGREQRFGEPLTTEQLLTRALESFDEALSTSQSTDAINVVRLAQVGKARVLLNLGKFQDAARVAGRVPRSYVYLVERSANSELQYNVLYMFNTVEERFSLANHQGDLLPPFLPSLDGAIPNQEDANLTDEGLPFLTARDPRVPWTRTFTGTAEADTVYDVVFDQNTPIYNLIGYPALGIALDRGAEVPLATGIEARLIEAETALNAGDTDRMRRILNELRATVELSALTGDQEFSGEELGPIPPPAQRDSLPKEPVALLFHERAFRLYATAHRLPDLRRLVGQYGRAAENVFPTGSYFKGGVYGDKTFLPVPQREENNPKFEGCLNQQTWDVSQ